MSEGAGPVPATPTAAPCAAGAASTGCARRRASPAGPWRRRPTPSARPRPMTAGGASRTRSASQSFSAGRVPHASRPPRRDESRARTARAADRGARHCRAREPGQRPCPGGTGRNHARRRGLHVSAASMRDRDVLAGPARGAARWPTRVAAVDLVAIVREDDVDQAAEVVTRIHQDQRGDYAAAARVLERRGDDVVVIQHEYGIFGGHEGAHILSLAAELRQPMVLTLHTVLSAPSVRQAETLRALCDLATLVCVFTETARRMILDARLVLARARPRRAARRADRAAPGADAGRAAARSAPRRQPRVERDRDRPLRAGDLRADLAGQGDRDRRSRRCRRSSRAIRRRCT